MSSREYDFSDLVEQAGEAADDAADATGGGGDAKGTGEWVAETVELLDKRGLLEPMLFGPEGAEELREANEQAVHEAAEGDEGEDGDGLALDAEGIAAACESIRAELGDDVTVAEVEEMCRKNPSLVNKQIEKNL